jgi:hypothetical protein
MADSHHYYLPQGAHEFLIWARNFTEVAGRNAAAWGLVQADIDDLKAGTDAYALALHTALAAKFKDYVNAKLRYSRDIDSD